MLSHFYSNALNVRECSRKFMVINVLARSRQYLMENSVINLDIFKVKIKILNNATNNVKPAVKIKESN